MDNAVFLETLEQRVDERRRKLLRSMRVRVEQAYHRMQEAGATADASSVSRSIIRLYGTAMRELGSTWVRSVDELLFEEGLERLPGSTTNLRRSIAEALCRDAARLERHMRKTLESLPDLNPGDGDGTDLSATLQEVGQRVDSHLKAEVDFSAQAPVRGRTARRPRGSEARSAKAKPWDATVEKDPFITVAASPKRTSPEDSTEPPSPAPPSQPSLVQRLLALLLPNRG